MLHFQFQLCFASANVNIFYLQRVENRAFVYLHRDGLSFIFSERSRSTSSPRSRSVPQAARPGQTYGHLKYLSRFIYQLHEIFNE
jgi:hypothetical protein